MAAQQMREHAQGNGALVAPLKARQGESFDVKLRVRQAPEADIVTGLKSSAPSGSQIVKSGVKDFPVTTRMVATLEAGDAEISPAEQAPRVVSAESDADWVWQVTPKHPGKLELIAQLNGTVQFGSESALVYPSAFQQTVQVSISPSMFVGDHWEWLFSVLLIPAGRIVWKWRKSRKQRPADD